MRFPFRRSQRARRRYFWRGGVMGDWLFDLGNTRLKCAPLHADGGFGDVLAAAHGGVDPAQACAAILPAQGDVAYLASVAAPVLTVGLLDALTQRFQRISI